MKIMIASVCEAALPPCGARRKRTITGCAALMYGTYPFGWTMNKWRSSLTAIHHIFNTINIYTRMGREMWFIYRVGGLCIKKRGVSWHPVVFFFSFSLQMWIIPWWPSSISVKSSKNLFCFVMNNVETWIMVLLFALQRLCSVLLKAKLSHISPLAYLQLFQVLQVTPAGYQQTKNVIELSGK